MFGARPPASRAQRQRPPPHISLQGQGEIGVSETGVQAHGSRVGAGTGRDAPTPPGGPGQLAQAQGLSQQRGECAEPSAAGGSPGPGGPGTRAAPAVLGPRARARAHLEEGADGREVCGTALPVQLRHLLAHLHRHGQGMGSASTGSPAMPHPETPSPPPPGTQLLQALSYWDPLLPPAPTWGPGA